MKINVLALLCVAALIGCSRTEPGGVPGGIPSKPIVPFDVKTIVPGPIPVGQAKAVPWKDGASIVVRNIDGVHFFEVEGTFEENAFRQILAATADKDRASRDAAIDVEIQRIFNKTGPLRGIPLNSVPEAGYFKFLLPLDQSALSKLSDMRFSRAILLNPVSHDLESLRTIKALRFAVDDSRSGRFGNKDFSGLQQLNAVKFVKDAQARIGEPIDGSSVRLGIADTGITYNHPTFLSADGKSVRISYLKDFTAEGRVYFNPSAKFEVTVPAQGAPENLVINAEVIETPKLPSTPFADRLTAVAGLAIKVSPELKALLTAPGASGAKLGMFSEDAFQSENEKPDLNGNGKLNDKFPVIMIPGETPEQDILYVDFDGGGDFRNARPVGNFNTTGGLVAVSAEKVGFDLKSVFLATMQGSPIQVRSASIVGLDAGDHGSHVAGIAAGRRTLLNDAETTLARGFAPNAAILMNRVCSNNAGCTSTEAIIDLALNGHADVINMSLGRTDIYNDGFGVEETLINRLTQVNNVLFVVAAGNAGPGKQTVGNPSVARLALSVGAAASRGMIERQFQWPGLGATTDGIDDPFVLFFSSRGPTSAGEFKPEVTAPGTELSSVRMNGAHGGLDVYWGTSMATPAAAGSYALLLDAVRKYNRKHPEAPLSAQSTVLKKVLVETAKPFDATLMDSRGGVKKTGQYTWVDQGAGMIDLAAAFDRLLAMSAAPLPTEVTLDGMPVELDYQVIISATNPNGQAYDGSREAMHGAPAFASGLFLDYFGTETLAQANIARRLPESMAASARVGELDRQLKSTSDEFELRTVIYGSDKAWIKAGTLSGPDCVHSGTSNLVVIGDGASIAIDENGVGTVVSRPASTLNICIDRRMVAEELPAGDNGALIYAYRTKEGRTSPVASFIVPVYLTVPNKTLAGSAGYDIRSTVNSFGVSRQYVYVPHGVGLLRVSLEVPEIKRDARGLVARGEECSGVELMSHEGTNVDAPFKTRAEARVSNCDSNGSPSSKKLSLSFAVPNPHPGMWDLHVLGSYAFVHSKFRLRVDYATPSESAIEIAGPVAALNGTLAWNVTETSLPVVADEAASEYVIDSLFSTTQAAVVANNTVIVPGPEGLLRRYPEGTQRVTLMTGGASGSEIDLTVMECPADAQAVNDDCTKVAASRLPGDEELVVFQPKSAKCYAVLVEDNDDEGSATFATTEMITLREENGTVRIFGTAPNFTVAYSMSADRTASSKLLTDTRFLTGKYEVRGALILKTSEKIFLTSIPVKIRVK